MRSFRLEDFPVFLPTATGLGGIDERHHAAASAVFAWSVLQRAIQPAMSPVREGNSPRQAWTEIYRSQILAREKIRCHASQRIFFARSPEAAAGFAPARCQAGNLWGLCRRSPAGWPQNFRLQRERQQKRACNLPRQKFTTTSSIKPPYRFQALTTEGNIWHGRVKPSPLAKNAACARPPRKPHFARPLQTTAYQIARWRLSMSARECSRQLITTRL